MSRIIRQTTRSIFFISIILLSLSLTLVCACSGGSTSKENAGSLNPASGPIRVHSSNLHYFTDGSGKAIYLTGSNLGYELQDNAWGKPFILNYHNYLNFLQSNNHNYIRLWSVQHSKLLPQNNVTTYPLPYKRVSGYGVANDGFQKFDLNQFDQAYFDRLRERCILARNNGIYVGVMLFQGWSITNMKDENESWTFHLFNAANNINNVDGDLDKNGEGREIYAWRGENDPVIQRERSYVRKVIDTLYDLDNIIFEIANEVDPHSADWQYEMIKYIRQYEATKGQRHHLVGLSFYGTDNTPLFNSPADWISPGGHKTNPNTSMYGFDPPAPDGSKVILLDTDHIENVRNINPNRQWVWKAFTRGNHIVLLDWGLDPRCVSDSSCKLIADKHAEMRITMGKTRFFADRMNLVSMVPREDLSSTEYCLANPGSEYLVYQPESEASFSVLLLAGTYNFEWFNPLSNGVFSAGSIKTSGGNELFAAPFAGDAVLYICKQ